MEEERENPDPVHTEDVRKEPRLETAAYFSRRRRRRKDFFEIREFGTQRLLGHVIDLSGHGLRVVGDFPFESGVRYKMTLVMPYAVEGEEVIQFHAWCRWTLQNVEEKLFYAGMEFAEIAEHEADKLAKLIASW